MKFIKKVLSTKIDDKTSTELNTGEFYNSMTGFIKNNSKLFSKSLFIRGDIGCNYFFDIENLSHIITQIGKQNLKPSVKITKSVMSTPKCLGIETKINYYFQNKYNNDIEITEKEERDYLTDMLYRPFMKAIEKCLIGGDYFDKPLFSTTNQISGTNDFTGLLKLVRKLKDTNDENIIVGNSSTISNIIETINKEAYLTEYLLNGTIERIPIIGTIEAPENENDNILVGFNPEKIGVLLADTLQCDKFEVVGNHNSFYHFYCFINGGDLFNNSIGLTI